MTTGPHNPYMPQPEEHDPLSQAVAPEDSTPASVTHDWEHSSVAPAQPATNGWEQTSVIPTQQPQQPWGQPMPTSQPVTNGWEQTSVIPTQQPQQPWGQPMPTSQPVTNGWEQTSAIPTQQSQQQQWNAWNQPMVNNMGNPTNKGSFFSIIDTSFRNYVTPAIAKVIYIIMMVATVLMWLGVSIYFFIAAANAGRYGGDQLRGMGIFWLLVGWIPAILQLARGRMLLESTLSNIRLAEDTEAIRQHLQENK
ncbi:MAG: DUF4282 domain-containing protein [Propionibacteriaceae bacterium]